MLSKLFSGKVYAFGSLIVAIASSITALAMVFKSDGHPERFVMINIALTMLIMAKMLVNDFSKWVQSQPKEECCSDKK